MEPRPRLFWCVFLPYACGHFLSALLRNANAVLAPQFIVALALTPAQLGMLTSVFFGAFALAQLPVGLALDRYGPRRVQGSLLLLAAAGAALFAAGHSYAALAGARFLIGLGMGASFMAGVKALAAGARAERLPSWNGCLIAAGGLGAAAAILPVRAAAAWCGWRGVFVLLAVLLLAASALVWTAAPRTARARTGVPLDAVTLRAILGHPVFRRTVSLVLLPHAVFFAVQGMWLGRWLADVGHFGEDAIAYLLYLSMAAVAFGAIAVGMVTEWAGRHGLAPRGVAVAGVTLFLLVQTALMIGYRPAFQTLPVLFTLAGSVTGIEYTIVAQGVPSELTGRAATCLNLLIFVAAFAVQAGFGLVLGCWTPDAAGHYPAQAYRAAFALLIAVQLPGLVQCVLASNRSDEHHETAPLRPPGKGKTGTAG